MSVLTNGNRGLGIGDNNPTARLQVNGNIKLTTGGYLAAAGNTDQLYIAYDGSVGIGTNNPSTTLYVQGDATANAYYYISDQRFKTDITTITDPLEKILALNGYMFTWKKDGKKDM